MNLKMISAVTVLLLATGSSFCLADEPGQWQRRHIQVQGEGKVNAVPDIAILYLECTQDGMALDQITTQVRQQMGKVLDAVKKAGVADKDLQTVSYNVQPKYTYKNGNAQPNGYRVANRIQAKIHDLGKVGHILSAAINAGANKVDGPNFDFENPQKLEQQALADAVENAAAKARVIAEAAHATLGPVLSVEQSGGPLYRPRPMMAARQAFAAAGAAPEPIEAGQQDFSATVTALFELR